MQNGKKGKVNALGLFYQQIQRIQVWDNIVPLIKSMEEQFYKCNQLKLSWFGRLAIVKKMNVLLKFLFIFWNIILEVAQKMLNKIQGLLNTFIWGYKK